MNEYRTDDRRRGHRTNERPPRSVPDMENLDVGALRNGPKAPLHVHSACDSPHMAKADGRSAGFWTMQFHFGEPPSGPIQRPERAIRRHFDYTAAGVVTIAHPDVPIMWQVRGPRLHIGRDSEDDIERRAHQSFVDSRHRSIDGHGAELVGRHATLRGVHEAVSRNPK